MRTRDAWFATTVIVTLAMASPPGHARDVTVAIGLSLSPYVISDENRGMEFDIAREALALEGHAMRPRYLPLIRVVKEIETGQTDAALTQQDNRGIPVHYSDVYITYQNVAITLASRQLRIERMEDLTGKSILAFQKATLYLGPAFKAAVEGNPQYREEAKQVLQPAMLYHDRIDVVIADRNIFSWFARQPEVTAKADTTQPLHIHPLFPPTDYRVAFRDPGLRDDFNRGLAKLKAGGDYDRIIQRYLPLMTATAK